MTKRRWQRRCKEEARKKQPEVAEGVLEHPIRGEGARIILLPSNVLLENQLNFQVSCSSAALFPTAEQPKCPDGEDGVIR